MKKLSRTDFVNGVMGLALGSTQGKYSYCNDYLRKVLFSLDISCGEDSDLILSPEWSKRGYSHSLKNIEKILNDDYELLIFKTKTRKNKNGVTIADGFDPFLEKRKLVVDGELFRAVPIVTSYESINRKFSVDVGKSSSLSSERRKDRLKTANKIPNKIMTSAIIYERNPDVVAEVLFQAEGKCQGCKQSAPFDRKSDGSPYLEVHHKQPLANGGHDTVENAIALCPNCHRKAHYG